MRTKSAYREPPIKTPAEEPLNIPPKREAAAALRVCDHQFRHHR